MTDANADPQPARAPDAEMYPIRTASTLTGVNAITLRACERRYGLIKPRRTAKGHRLYNRRDIELINRIVALLDKGLTISQVAHAVGEETVPEASGLAQELDIWVRCRESMIDAITRFDENALEESYNDALSLYPIDLVTTRLLVRSAESGRDDVKAQWRDFLVGQDQRGLPGEGHDACTGWVHEMIGQVKVDVRLVVADQLTQREDALEIPLGNQWMPEFADLDIPVGDREYRT
jgi:DNA-binding transcriptional MerR regulator